jgi:hypothetical protein
MSNVVKINFFKMLAEGQELRLKNLTKSLMRYRKEQIMNNELTTSPSSEALAYIAGLFDGGRQCIVQTVHA